MSQTEPLSPGEVHSRCNAIAEQAERERAEAAGHRAPGAYEVSLADARRAGAVAALRKMRAELEKRGLSGWSLLQTELDRLDDDDAVTDYLERRGAVAALRRIKAKLEKCADDAWDDAVLAYENAAELAGDEADAIERGEREP